MIRFFFFLIFLVSLGFANDGDGIEQKVEVEELQKQLEIVDFALKDNIWLIRYENYLSYTELIEKLEDIDGKLDRYKDSKLHQDKIIHKELLLKKDNLTKQIELLQNFKISPFSKIIKPDELIEKPKVTNPLMIIKAFSYIQQIEKGRKHYAQNIASIKKLIANLKEKKVLIEELLPFYVIKNTTQTLEKIRMDLDGFNKVYILAKSTFALYSKKVDEAKLSSNEDIKEQASRILNLVGWLFFVIVIAILFKLIAKRVIDNSERYYMANKIINFININIIIIILLYAYVDNISYFVTILGFASAGIAIAMKDWFMSVLGWMVIVFGGSFHVGDRVKIQKDGLVWVGDIIDISFLRMTILEDVTMTTYKETRRSGRVGFIPNNYIFTTLISSYTHGSLKTVWDGIDFTITFDSNHKKAMEIAREITLNHSKENSDIAKKARAKLRDQYNLRNSRLEPRIYSFIEANGIVISSWYRVDSYSTLLLRSQISSDIIDAINKEDDIAIAYPTQTINLKQNRVNIENDESIF